MSEEGASTISVLSQAGELSTTQVASLSDCRGWKRKVPRGVPRNPDSFRGAVHSPGTAAMACRQYSIGSDSSCGCGLFIQFVWPSAFLPSCLSWGGPVWLTGHSHPVTTTITTTRLSYSKWFFVAGQRLLFCCCFFCVLCPTGLPVTVSTKPSVHCCFVFSVSSGCLCRLCWCPPNL